MVQFYTADELAQLRAEILGLLPDSAVIKRVSSSISNEGYEQGSLTVMGTVSARIDPIKQATPEQYAQADKGRSIYQLTVPYDANILSGDTVTISGVDYEVKQAHTGHSGRLVKRAVCTRLGE